MSTLNNNIDNKNLPRSEFDSISFVEGAGKTRRWVHPSVSPELLAQATRAREQYLSSRDGAEAKHSKSYNKSTLESGCDSYSTSNQTREAEGKVSQRIRWELRPSETLPQLSVRMPFEPHGTRVLRTTVLPSYLANSIVDHLYESNACILLIDDEGLNCISPDGLVRFVVSLMEVPNPSGDTPIEVGRKRRSICHGGHCTSTTRNILMEVRKSSGTSFQYLELVKGIFSFASDVADCCSLNPSKTEERSIKRPSLSLEHPPIPTLVRDFAPSHEIDKSPSSDVISCLQKSASFSNSGVPFFKMISFYTDSVKLGSKALANADNILDNMSYVIVDRIEALSPRPSEPRTQALLAFQSVLNCVQISHIRGDKIEFRETLYKCLLEIISNADTQAYDAMISLKCLNILFSISNFSHIMSRGDLEGIVRAAFDVGTMRYLPLQEESKRFLLAMR